MARKDKRWDKAHDSWEEDEWEDKQVDRKRYDRWKSSIREKRRNKYQEREEHLNDRDMSTNFF
jgi:hypothetical protein